MPQPPFDLIAFLQRIVAIDSCDPPGGELAVAEVVHAQLLALGIESTIDMFQPGRANVLGRIRGRGARPALVLSAHMDTVPPGQRPWTRPPFSAAIDGDRLHGRGTSDMKGALAAMIAAAAEIAARPAPLAGDVILAFTAGESANLLGARRFIAQGLPAEIGAFLCGEPSSLDIVVAEKAALWLRATAEGRVGHVSGDPGVNAIGLMQRFLAALEGVVLEVPAHPLLDAPTLRVGRIEGGSAVNLTPDRCLADIDIRLPPGVAPEAVIARLEAVAPAGVTFTTLDFKPAVERAPEDPFVQLCAAVTAGQTGRAPAIRGVSYYSDATVLLEGLSVPFAIIGPGDLGLSGQPDESVSIAHLHHAAAIYAGAAARWLA